jgi:hypothetical protein
VGGARRKSDIRLFLPDSGSDSTKRKAKTSQEAESGILLWSGRTILEKTTLSKVLKQGAKRRKH